MLGNLSAAEEEFLGRQVVDTALQLHKYFWAGLLESLYEECFAMV